MHGETMKLHPYGV